MCTRITARAGISLKATWILQKLRRYPFPLMADSRSLVPLGQGTNTVPDTHIALRGLFPRQFFGGGRESVHVPCARVRDSSIRVDVTPITLSLPQRCMPPYRYPDDVLPPADLTA